jgi:hypothetical protein
MTILSPDARSLEALWRRLSEWTNTAPILGRVLTQLVGIRAGAQSEPNDAILHVCRTNLR